VIKVGIAEALKFRGFRIRCDVTRISRNLLVIIEGLQRTGHSNVDRTSLRTGAAEKIVLAKK
jgi:hypothetical protein